MIRFRTLHLIHGGRQCDEYKNQTKHCTPYELPPGNVKALLNSLQPLGNFAALYITFTRVISFSKS